MQPFDLFPLTLGDNSSGIATTFNNPNYLPPTIIPAKTEQNISSLSSSSASSSVPERKPYKCNMCPKTFANSSYLSQHSRIHAGIRPYRCEQCTRKFTQLSHLQQHVRTHTGDKPYKCSQAGCEKAFTQLSSLQSHTRCHITNKRFKCNSCYKCFEDELSLRVHIPKHQLSKHSKTHICYLCGKSYTQELYLVKHVSKHKSATTSDPSLLCTALSMRLSCVGTSPNFQATNNTPSANTFMSSYFGGHFGGTTANFQPFNSMPNLQTNTTVTQMLVSSATQSPLLGYQPLVNSQRPQSLSYIAKDMYLASSTYLHPCRSSDFSIPNDHNMRQDNLRPLPGGDTEYSGSSGEGIGEGDVLEEYEDEDEEFEADRDRMFNFDEMYINKIGQTGLQDAEMRFIPSIAHLTPSCFPHDTMLSGYNYNHPLTYINTSTTSTNRLSSTTSVYYGSSSSSIPAAVLLTPDELPCCAQKTLTNAAATNSSRNNNLSILPFTLPSGNYYHHYYAPTRTDPHECTTSYLRNNPESCSRRLNPHRDTGGYNVQQQDRTMISNNQNISPLLSGPPSIRHYFSQWTTTDTTTTVDKENQPTESGVSNITHSTFEETAPIRRNLQLRDYSRGRFHHYSDSQL